MKFKSIIAAGLLLFSCSGWFQPQIADAYSEETKEKFRGLLTRLEQPLKLKEYTPSNPFSLGNSGSYKFVMLNRQENSIGLDANGKVTSFIIMEFEMLAQNYRYVFSREDHDVFIKVHPDGHFTAFKTIRSGSDDAEQLASSWRPVGEEIEFTNLKALPKWLANRYKFLPKALYEAQGAADLRKKIKADLAQ